MSNQKLDERRRFLKYAGLTLAATPLLRLPASATDSPKVEESDPTAQGLGYRHDATQVDEQKYPRSAPVDGVRPVCANCALYQGSAEDPWAGCPIFANKEVKGTGWCSAWAPRPE